MGSVRWKREKDAAVSDSYIIKRQEKDMGEKGRQNKRKGSFSLVSFIFLWLFYRYHSSQYYVENEMAAENSSCYVPA